MNKELIKAKVTLGRPLTPEERAEYIFKIATNLELLRFLEEEKNGIRSKER